MTSRNALHQELKRNIESERNSVHRSGYEDDPLHEFDVYRRRAELIRQVLPESSSKRDGVSKSDAETRGDASSSLRLLWREYQRKVRLNEICLGQDIAGIMKNAKSGNENEEHYRVSDDPQEGYGLGHGISLHSVSRPSTKNDVERDERQPARAIVDRIYIGGIFDMDGRVGVGDEIAVNSSASEDDIRKLSGYVRRFTKDGTEDSNVWQLHQAPSASLRRRDPEKWNIVKKSLGNASLGSFDDLDEDGVLSFKKGDRSVPSALVWEYSRTKSKSNPAASTCKVMSVSKASIDRDIILTRRDKRSQDDADDSMWLPNCIVSKVHKSEKNIAYDIEFNLGTILGEQYYHRVSNVHPKHVRSKDKDDAKEFETGDEVEALYSKKRKMRFAGEVMDTAEPLRRIIEETKSLGFDTLSSLRLMRRRLRGFEISHRTRPGTAFRVLSRKNRGRTWRVSVKPPVLCRKHVDDDPIVSIVSVKLSKIEEVGKASLALRRPFALIEMYALVAKTHHGKRTDVSTFSWTHEISTFHIRKSMLQRAAKDSSVASLRFVFFDADQQNGKPVATMTLSNIDALNCGESPDSEKPIVKECSNEGEGSLYRVHFSVWKDDLEQAGTPSGASKADASVAMSGAVNDDDGY